MNTRSIATVALLGLAVRGAAIVALHILRTDHDPLVSFVSEYGIGPYAWLSKTANIAGFCAIAAMLRALLSAQFITARSIISAVLVFHIAMRILTLLFPVDPIAAATADGGIPEFSIAGWIHAIAGALAAVSLIAAMVLVTMRGHKTGRIGGITRALALLCILAPVMWVLTAVTPPAAFPSGLYQRIFVASTWLWLVLVCTVLIRGRFDTSTAARTGAAL